MGASATMKFHGSPKNGRCFPAHLFDKRRANADDSARLTPNKLAFARVIAQHCAPPPPHSAYPFEAAVIEALLKAGKPIPASALERASSNRATAQSFSAQRPSGWIDSADIDWGINVFLNPRMHRTRMASVRGQYRRALHGLWKQVYALYTRLRMRAVIYMDAFRAAMAGKPLPEDVDRCGKRQQRRSPPTAPIRRNGQREHNPTEPAATTTHPTRPSHPSRSSTPQPSVLADALQAVCPRATVTVVSATVATPSSAPSPTPPPPQQPATPASDLPPPAQRPTSTTTDPAPSSTAAATSPTAQYSSAAGGAASISQASLASDNGCDVTVVQLRPTATTLRVGGQLPSATAASVASASASPASRQLLSVTPKPAQPPILSASLHCTSAPSTSAPTGMVDTTPVATPIARADVPMPANTSPDGYLFVDPGTYGHGDYREELRNIHTAASSTDPDRRSVIEGLRRLPLSVRLTPPPDAPSWALWGLGWWSERSCRYVVQYHNGVTSYILAYPWEVVQTPAGLALRWDPGRLEVAIIRED